MTNHALARFVIACVGVLLVGAFLAVKWLLGH